MYFFYQQSFLLRIVIVPPEDQNNKNYRILNQINDEQFNSDFQQHHIYAAENYEK